MNSMDLNFIKYPKNWFAANDKVCSDKQMVTDRQEEILPENGNTSELSKPGVGPIVDNETVPSEIEMGMKMENESTATENTDDSTIKPKAENDQKMLAVFDAIRTLFQKQDQLLENQQRLSENIHILKDELVRVNEKQANTIQKQHNAALKFQEDVIFKTQKGLIMELIGIADNIQMMIEDKESDPEYDLLGAVKDLAKWVDASLNNNSVKRFKDTEQDNTVYNRKRQELVEKEITDNPEENNTYKTLHPGYEWTLPYLVINSDVQLLRIIEENRMPKMFSFVIRPEEIVKLIYKENITE